MSRLSLRLRIGVLERDGYRCVYCGRASSEVKLQIDHVKARVDGGTDAPTNLVSACFECNNGKRAAPIELPVHVDTSIPLRGLSIPARRPARARPDQSHPFDGPLDVRFTSWARAQVRCDDCGEPADTVHFLPWVVRSQEARLACPAHDPGGYWLYWRGLWRGPIDWRFRDPSRRYTGFDHLESKGADEAIALLLWRIRTW